MSGTTSLGLKYCHSTLNNATAWFNKGYALGGDEGKWDEALMAFSKVQTLDPNYPYLQSNINIAQQNLEASTPVYIKYAPAIVAAIVIIGGAGLWLYVGRKKLGVKLVVYPKLFAILGEY